MSATPPPMPGLRFLSAAALALLLPPTGGPRGPLAPAMQPVADAAGRPVVLVLHGRGLQESDTTALRRAWTWALDDGLAAVSAPSLLREDDVRLVWYADALEPRAAGTCAREGRSGSRGERGGQPGGWAREVGATLGATGSLMGLVARWMGGPEGAALEALAGDLLYLGDDRRRCGAAERLEGALAAAEAEGRPILLVAHSFGALVAWDHLRTRPEDAPRVERWITVGSLLGHPELREILLAGGGGTGLPAGVGSWVNVRDPRDPLAAPLVGLGRADGQDGAIVDRVTERDAAGDPHDPGRYLSDPATARAILEAWCDAALTPPAATRTTAAEPGAGGETSPCRA